MIFDCCLLVKWERELSTVVSCLTGFQSTSLEKELLTVVFFWSGRESSWLSSNCFLFNWVSEPFLALSLCCELGSATLHIRWYIYSYSYKKEVISSASVCVCYHHDHSRNPISFSKTVLNWELIEVFNLNSSIMAYNFWQT